MTVLTDVLFNGVACNRLVLGFRTSEMPCFSLN